MSNKGLDAIKAQLHPDFLFVADFELLTREDWLDASKKEFDDGEETFHDNAKCLLETKHLVVFEQKYVLDRQFVLSVNTTHFRNGKPWRPIINRAPIEE